MRGYQRLEHFVPAFPDEAVLTHLIALADVGSKIDLASADDNDFACEMRVDSRRAVSWGFQV